jgi:hypothetical protein
MVVLAQPMNRSEIIIERNMDFPNAGMQAGQQPARQRPRNSMYAVFRNGSKPMKSRPARASK